MSETSMYKDLTVVVVNFQTPDLLERSIRSLRQYYPDQIVLIVDNGSRDDSASFIKQLVAAFPASTNSLLLKRNIFHGPAMHQAIAHLHTPYVFFLDSDTEVTLGGFLEPMMSEFQSDRAVYAVGKMGHVNKRGFAAHEGIPIVLSPYMILRKEMYVGLPPFEHHGMPTLKNFSAAHDRGMVVKDFPIDRFIRHKGRGTASRFGYGLGIKGKVDYVLNKLGL
jgi:cellulose synthase/poly-beta-1,6-N-acetylglucosamine synthase-like glycosyltransferase